MPNDFHYSLSMERYRVSHVSEQIPNALRDTNPALRAKPRRAHHPSTSLGVHVSKSRCMCHTRDTSHSRSAYIGNNALNQ